MVTLQELNKVPSHNLPTEAYPPAIGTSLSVDGFHDPVGDEILSDQGRNYFLDMGTNESGDHKVTLDQQDAPLATTTNDFRASHPRRSMSMSEPGKMQRAVKSTGSFGANRPLPSHVRELHAIANTTPAQDFASSLVSTIEAAQYQNKAEILSALQAKLSLLDVEPTNKSKKRSHIDSPSRNATMGAERLWQCRYCPKQKKTQCELKYALSSSIPDSVQA